MNELLSSGLWPRIREFAKNAKRKLAAVAYVTDDTHIKFGVGDTLVTDASDEAIKSGQTSAALLKSALKRGAEIASISGLHSKVYIFDRYAIIGSANLSKESQRRTEAALVTDQPTIVSSAIQLVKRLATKGEEVDESFIKRICKLPVAKRKQVRAEQKHEQLDDTVPRSWLVGLKGIKVKESEQTFFRQGLDEAEEQIVNEDSTVSMIRYRGNSRFRREAKEGDLVVRIWTDTSKAKPNRVYHHAPILLRKVDNDSDLTMLYVEEYRDAEETTITWKGFQKLYSQIGLPGKPSQWSTREIKTHHSEAMHNLWFED